VQVLVVVSNEDGSIDRLRHALETAGLELTTTSDARETEYRATAHPFEALVFDPALVDADLEARIRARRPALPLIAWLSSSSSSRTAELLAGGADEVVHATMGEQEVAVRVVTAIRRGTAGRAGLVEVGPLRIDIAGGHASWDGVELPLTRREREVLVVLAESAGRPLRREVLYRRVWGFAMARGDRTVDVNVRRLRAKLTTAAGDRIAIRTQTGVGYRLDVGVPSETVTTL
jgi:DNA-binding response OmpR family regulator